MLSYTPKYFKPHELVGELFFNECKALYTAYFEARIYALFDPRILWTHDRLREKFGSCTINNWANGGTNHRRGYRETRYKVENYYRKKLLIKERDPIGSFASTHCDGRGLDSNYANATPQEVRDYIKGNYKTDPILQYITCIEDFPGMNWCHIDCRNYDRDKYGLLVVSG